MKDAERIPGLLDDLERDLAQADELVGRGREAYDDDPAIRLAFEALSNRIGDLAKRLIAVDPVRFSATIWSQAARNRDFVVHHYHRVDTDALWNTAANSFPQLRAAVTKERKR